MILKPVIAGAVIRDPHTKRLLPQEGGVVPDSTFWLRRLLAKEVAIVEAPPSAPDVSQADVSQAPAKLEKKG